MEKSVHQILDLLRMKIRSDDATSTMENIRQETTRHGDSCRVAWFMEIPEGRL